MLTQNQSKPRNICFPKAVRGKIPADMSELNDLTGIKLHVSNRLAIPNIPRG
jgi:hypothetical protein